MMTVGKRLKISKETPEAVNRISTDNVMTKKKMTNNDQQNIKQKTKDSALLKACVNFGRTIRSCSCCKIDLQAFQSQKFRIQQSIPNDNNAILDS